MTVGPVQQLWWIYSFRAVLSTENLYVHIVTLRHIHWQTQFLLKTLVTAVLVTFARSDICAKWLKTGRARRGKGTKLGEGERH